MKDNQEEPEPEGHQGGALDVFLLHYSLLLSDWMKEFAYQIDDDVMEYWGISTFAA